MPGDNQRPRSNRCEHYWITFDPVRKGSIILMGVTLGVASIFRKQRLLRQNDFRGLFGEGSGHQLAG